MKELVDGTQPGDKRVFLCKTLSYQGSNRNLTSYYLFSFRSCITNVGASGRKWGWWPRWRFIYLSERIFSSFHTQYLAALWPGDVAFNENDAPDYDNWIVKDESVIRDDVRAIPTSEFLWLDFWSKDVKKILVDPLPIGATMIVWMSFSTQPRPVPNFHLVDDFWMLSFGNSCRYHSYVARTFWNIWLFRQTCPTVTLQTRRVVLPWSVHSKRCGVMFRLMIWLINSPASPCTCDRQSWWRSGRAAPYQEIAYRNQPWRSCRSCMRWTPSSFKIDKWCGSLFW